MALQLKGKHRSHGITWQSGHLYQFKYTSWIHDPEPTYMHFYSVLGIHPNTGHQHRYNTGINFTYIPRTIRRAFANIWLKEYEKSKGNMNFTWERVQQQFPYLEGAVRRYMLKPVYYIQNAREVSFENMEDVIVSTWNKDFSKKLRTDLKQKFRRATGNAEKNNKKTGLWGRFFK